MTDDEKKIEVIKWSCAHGLADGFDLGIVNGLESLIFPNGDYTTIQFFAINRYKPLWWPLFLQRTVQGLEKKGTIVRADYDPETENDYWPWVANQWVSKRCYAGVDEATYQAITWIMGNSR